MRRIVLGWVAVTLACLCSNTVRAQDALLNDIYGLGVHAYYDNSYSRAHELFTAAIEQGSQDPRVYYFRGLTYQVLGRPDEAAVDFRTGAQLELTTVLPVPIGHSLQRVQGSQRMMLEQYRREARLAVRAQQLDIERVRYEQRQQAEAGVRRDPEAAALPVPDLPAVRQPDPTDPFGGESLTAPPPAASPATPAPMPAAEPDLFGDTPTEPMPTQPAPAMPAEDDPFGAPAATTPAPMPAAPAAEDDPFGIPASPDAALPAATEDDPFGAPAPAAAPMPAIPAEADDPFGDDKAVDAEPAPAAVPAPAPMPAGANDDPFADDPQPAADDVPAAAPAPAAENPPATPPAEAMPAEPANDDPFADPFAQ